MYTNDIVKSQKSNVEKWIAWIKSLPSLQKFPRCIPKTRAIISGVELHGFGDASKNGCCSAIYAVIAAMCTLKVLKVMLV